MSGPSAADAGNALMRGAMAIALVLAMLLIESCSLPVMFRVEVDEAIDHGTLTLNGRSVGLMKNVDGAYWAKWNGSDASGQIDIVFTDRAGASCAVGYVTHGISDIQQFLVRRRRCMQVFTR